MKMLTPLHIRLLQYAADHNFSGLPANGMDSETYTATRELYWDGYLAQKTFLAVTYHATDKGLAYLQGVGRLAKWNAAVSGKGGQS